MSRRRAPRHERAIVSAICSYELVALWTPLPTITWLSHRHPWLGDAIKEALDQHFIPPKEA